MSNDKKDNGGSQGDDESPKDKKQIFLSNNFFNYRSNKFNSRDQEPNHNAKQRKNAPCMNTNDSSRSSLRDHFLAPLTDTSIKKDPKAMPTESSTPSVFTDAERSKTLDSFSKIFMQQIGDAISSGKLSRAWYGGNIGGSWLTTDYSKIGTWFDDLQNVDSKDYVAERKMIQPHLTPFVWGVTCSAITLFSLRFGKWYQTRKLGPTFIPKSNNVTDKTVTKLTDTSSMQDLRSNIPNNYATYSTNARYSPKETSGITFENLMSLPVDMALSMLIGISTSVYLTQPQTLMRDLSEAPLLEGKSVFAEELCGPFTEEMEKINEMVHAYCVNPNDDVQKEAVSFKEMWRDENLGEFESLRAVRNFVRNCRQSGS
jgi:hypothetical protein